MYGGGPCPHNIHFLFSLFLYLFLLHVTATEFTYVYGSLVLNFLPQKELMMLL